jgi:FG-GAP repeat
VGGLPGPFGVMAGDLDGDGRAEVVVANQYSNLEHVVRDQVTILWNRSHER